MLMVQKRNSISTDSWFLYFNYCQ